MGCSLPVRDSSSATGSMSRNQFSFECAVGKGGFGNVWSVTHKRQKQQYAMKTMLKARVLAKRSVHSVMNERKLLEILHHPFIINMHYAFQDKEHLYLLLDFLPGGDLRYHLGRQRRFTEEQTKFIVACLLVALEYLHLNGIIHRDLKPENLVFDRNGYVKLTDFGVARVWQPENSAETSGTPGYMAPEVLCRLNHTITVDYFALGVIVYEFMTGRRPYVGRNRKEVKDAILTRQVQLSKKDTPSGWSAEAVDFCNKLIQRKPANRLGANGPQEVRAHAWLRGFAFDKLIEKRLEAPYVPSEGNNFDNRQVLKEWGDEDAVSAVKNSSLVNLFSGYCYERGSRPTNATNNMEDSDK